MSATSHFTAPNNPFATRYVRPGALPYLFSPGDDARKCIARLVSQRWWGQIVGPHGSGKSTLIAALLPHLRAAGRQPRLVTLHDGQRKLVPESISSGRWNAQTQVIVDGYEQLGWWSRRQLVRRCRAAGCGLLVSTHQPFRLPTIVTTEPSLPVVQQLVRILLQPTQETINGREIAACFQASGGNVRDTLFDLYDVYERRKQLS